MNDQHLPLGHETKHLTSDFHTIPISATVPALTIILLHPLLVIHLLDTSLVTNYGFNSDLLVNTVIVTCTVFLKNTICAVLAIKLFSCSNSTEVESPILDHSQHSS